MSIREEANIISPYIYVGIRRKDLPHDFKVRMRRRVCRYKIDFIFEAIKMVTEHTREEMRGRYRGRTLVQARQMYCHFAKTLLGWSLADIGELINKDHTTVIHSLNVFSDLYQTDENFKQDADRVLQEIEWMTQDIILKTEE
jgi:chromosomal replication initiation ATPase DnaA